jgi:hypothetical protein
MARAEFDFSELDRWTADLRAAPAVTRAQARAVVAKGSLNIKTEARRNAPGGSHAPYYASSISFDVTETPVEIVGEIGPAEGRRQWGMGNLLEYGSENNPPHPHLSPALDHEEPKFIPAAEALAAEAIERG